nr:MAG TPA: tail protein [Caudoviricetes sp.]
MIINIHDKSLNIIGVLDNSVQNAVHFDEDKLTEDLSTGSSVYEFTAFKNDFMRYETTAINPFDSLVVGNWISFKHCGKEYLLKIVDTERKSDEVYVYAEDLVLELRNENVSEFSTEDEKTIEEYIKDMKLIDYSGMSIRINEAGTLKKALSFSNTETKLARLLALFKEFGVEHEFTLKLKPNGKVRDFYVDIYLPRDNLTGEGGVGKFKSDIILREGKEIETIAEKQNILEVWNRTRPIGKNTVTRVEVKDAKTATVAKDSVVVSSNMVNANGTLSIENIQIILKYCYEYRLLPSGVISQLYLESFWGNSSVARVDNNWSGMTWTGNPNRPSGVVVSQGSARPSNEGGYYMHFANMDDFFKDYFYLLAKQGIYNVSNKNNISDYTKGLFRVGGATYDYAAAGYDHYDSLMTGIRNGINRNNSNVLDTYDDQWRNPNIVTSTTVEIASAGKTKSALNELAGLVGKTVGNGQCYAVPAWLSYKLGGAGLGCGLGGFSGLVGSGVRACDIGTDYAWSNFGWGLKVSGLSASDILSGSIINIRANYGAPWYTGYYGHTVVVESIDGDTMTVIQQNYAGKQYLTRNNYSISQVLPSIQSIVYTPELTSGGRVEGGNKVVQENVTERYVSVDLPTEVETTEETLDIYISQDTFREYFDDNGALEFRVKDGFLDAVQSVELYPSQFSAQDGGDKWIRRDFEYQASSEEELIEKALADIKENCYPKIDFEVQGYFDGKIGDTFLIESPKFKPQLNIKARIVSKETSFTRPKNSKATFANYIKLKSQVSDILQQRLEAILESKIPYEIRVTASNGTSFKNNEGESEITVELLKTGITQDAEFLFKNGDSIVGKGTKFLVKSSDFEGLLNLTISAYIGSEEVATKQLSFTNMVEPTNIIIKTSSGNIFKNNLINTMLTATLWRGGKEIDKEGKDYSYIWTKTDADGEPDVLWNQTHTYSQKSIKITQQDVFRRAQFECNVAPLG